MEETCDDKETDSEYEEYKSENSDHDESVTSISDVEIDSQSENSSDTEDEGCLNAKTNTFLSEIWSSIEQKKIPSLFALSCATIYFSLPVKENDVAAVEVGCGASQDYYVYHDYYVSECHGNCSLWELINKGINLDTASENCKHFELNVQKVELEHLKALNLPQILLDYMILPKYSVYYSDVSLWDIADLPPRGKIKWVHAEGEDTDLKRMSQYSAYETFALFEEDLHCVEGLEALGCRCMQRYHEDTQERNKWDCKQLITAGLERLNKSLKQAQG